MFTSVGIRTLVVLGMVVSALLPTAAAAQGAPGRPSGLTGTPLSATSMKLDWTDNSVDETQFRIERSPDGVAFASLGTVAADVTTYTDATVVGDALYHYRVFAGSVNGDSNPSNTFTGFTADTVPPPVPTLSLPARGDQLDTHNVRFEWNSVSDMSGVTYTILVWSQGTEYPIQLVSGISGNSINLLLYDGAYGWNVKAKDGAGNESAVSEDWYCLIAALDPWAPDVAVTSPNGGEVLKGGSYFAVTWYTIDRFKTPTPELKIGILFSRDNGDNWEQIAHLDYNLSAYNWHVPNINCDKKCLIRVTSENIAGNIGSDDSNSAFSIVYTPKSSPFHHKSKNDFDNDGRSDIGCLDPADGSWYEFRSREGFVERDFGFSGAVPIAGDFDGDGRSDIGAHQSDTGSCSIYKSSAGLQQTTIGRPGSIPVTGDFDGDLRDDIGAYDASSGKWSLTKSTEGIAEIAFGFAGTIPVTGDFDGDGRDDIGVYYPPAGAWYLFKSTEGFYQTNFGFDGTIPVVGDFDGDGRDDIGVYFAPEGNWYFFKSAEGFFQTRFGYEGTVPVVGDYDNDGKSDFGVYDDRGGDWYLFKSSEGFFHTQFGYEGTIPIGGTRR